MAWAHFIADATASARPAAPGLVRRSGEQISPDEIRALEDVVASLGRIAKPSSNAPNPFPQPLGDYRLQIQKTELAIRHATQVAARSGDLSAIAELLSGRPNPQLRFHVDYEGLVAEELAASLGVGDNEKALADDLRPIREHLVAEFERVMAPPHLPDAESPAAIVDTVFMPQDAHQARLMAAACRSLPEGSYRFISSDRCDGNQGTDSALLDEGLVALSANEWLLSNEQAKRVVVAVPRGMTTDGMATAASTAGATVIEIAQPSDDVVQIADAQSRELP